MSAAPVPRTLHAALYSALLRALAPAYCARLWWRGRSEPLYRHALGERFGRYRGAATAGALWIHAVSLGETHAAAALIDALRSLRPGLRLLLTHGTATGRKAGGALLREHDAQAWLPYDTPGAVSAFLDHWRPALGVLMETEVWPNLLPLAKAHGVPLLLANARLSEKSRRRGLRLGALLRPAVAALDGVLAQSEADAGRLRSLGAPAVSVMGNLKFDVTPDAALLARGAAWAHAGVRAVVLGAVMREGEEQALLAAWARALPLSTRPRLWLVPRHPQRFDEVAAAVERAGFTLSRRSQWPAGLPDAAACEADVWLGDSMGEMPAYYAAARVALLGGSFEPLGGHNLIEAAACACPLVMGPHTFNFADAAELSLAAGASARVGGMEQGVALALALAADPATQAVMSARAREFAAAHRGAAKRMAHAVLELLDARGEAARHAALDPAAAQAR